MATTLTKVQTAQFFLCRSKLNDTFYGDYWVWKDIADSSGYASAASNYEALESDADNSNLIGMDVNGNQFGIQSYPNHPRPTSNRP